MIISVYLPKDIWQKRVEYEREESAPPVEKSCRETRWILFFLALIKFKVSLLIVKYSQTNHHYFYLYDFNMQISSFTQFTQLQSSNTYKMLNWLLEVKKNRPDFWETDLLLRRILEIRFETNNTLLSHSRTTTYLFNLFINFSYFYYWSIGQKSRRKNRWIEFFMEFSLSTKFSMFLLVKHMRKFFLCSQ